MLDLHLLVSQAKYITWSILHTIDGVDTVCPHFHIYQSVQLGRLQSSYGSLHFFKIKASFLIDIPDCLMI